MKTTTLYDFTLNAGGAQVILADANMYKVLTATGNISVTRDGGATIKPLRAGRGERNVAFTRLILRDLSGAPNSGTILVGDSDFIDDTIVLSSAINVRPEAQSGFFSESAAIAASTPDTVFTAASNTGGAILLSAGFSIYSAGSIAVAGFLSKATAPTTPLDGSPLCMSGQTSNTSGGSSVSMAQLASSQYIAAGQGLYFISDTASTGSAFRGCRYKLL